MHLGEPTKCDCVFYEEPPPGSDKPVKVWLESLKGANLAAYDGVYRKFALLELRGIDESMQSGLLKHVRGKIVEMKVRMRGAQPRVLGWIGRSKVGRQRFVAASSEMKDQPELDEATIVLAEQRMESWNARFKQ